MHGLGMSESRSGNCPFAAAANLVSLSMASLLTGQTSAHCSHDIKDLACLASSSLDPGSPPSQHVSDYCHALASGATSNYLTFWRKIFFLPSHLWKLQLLDIKKNSQYWETERKKLPAYKQDLKV